MRSELCFDAKTITEQCRKALAHPIELSLICGPFNSPSLSAAEQERANTYKHEGGKEAYLRGRAALKALLSVLKQNEDTSLLAFPSPNFSLSHSGDCALAAASPNGDLCGLGVDIEMNRLVKPKMTKFYLTEQETSYINTVSIEKQNSELLRLWTIKEALFKADLNNRGMVIGNYSINRPADLCGTAIVKSKEDSPTFSYISLLFPEACVSVAILKGVSPCH